jgi:hypothetical protein
MFRNHNPALESKNFIDGLIFTRDDPCVWVVYPAGAAGDLLISIIDKHYLRTGCDYYGINDQGRVMIYTSDYEMIDIAIKNKGKIIFNDQWFYNFSDQLGARNLTYSMLDQVIFGCHMNRPPDIQTIIDNFSQAKIINVYPKDAFGEFLRYHMATFKLKNLDLTKEVIDSFVEEPEYIPRLVNHERVLNVPFGFLFNQPSYDKYYKIIREFLGIGDSLICFEFIKFYLSRQHEIVKTQLETYSQGL